MRIRFLDAFFTDARFALRHFSRRSATTFFMLLVLTVGLTISTSLFSFLHSYAVQPAPGIERADDLVRIRGLELGSQGLGSRRFPEAELHGYQGLTEHFTAVTGWTNDQVMVFAGEGLEGDAVWATATFASGRYFEVLGVRPQGGSLPAAGRRAERPLAAVISDSLWERVFARRPEAIGSPLTINGVAITVAGVAPPKFRGVDMLTHYKLWLPSESRPLLVAAADAGSPRFAAAARLRPGVSSEAATAAVQVIAARAALDDPPASAAGEAPQRGTDVVPMAVGNGDPGFENDVRLMGIAFVVLALIVLGVTCTNVSALQTGLAMARGREIAVRLSMGAHRMRIVRQLLTESVLLALMAGITAVGIVRLAEHAVAVLVPDMPFAVVLSWPAALFTFSVALVAGLVFGLSPALHATRFEVFGTLKESGGVGPGKRGWLQRALVVAQIAFTQPLVVALAALLLVLAGAYQRSVASGLADQIVSMQLRPALVAPGAVAGEGRTGRVEENLSGIAERLEGMPGVVATAADPRFGMTFEHYSVHPSDRVAGGSAAAVRLAGSVVAPGFFDVMGLRVLAGRALSDADAGSWHEATAGAIPVVVGAGLAMEMWPGASPVGRRLQPQSSAASRQHTLVVTGVVEDPASPAAGAKVDRSIYLPASPARIKRADALLVRTSGDAQPLLPAIRQVVQQEAPYLAFVTLQTLADVEGQERRLYLIATAVLAGAGLLALLLAAVGLYAVIAFSVAQQTGEIAVRMAVGARAPQVAGRFVRDGMVLGSLGLLVGLPLSLLGLHFLLALPDFLPDIPVGLVAVAAAAGVMSVAAVATWAPARRAAAVAPATVLRDG